MTLLVVGSAVETRLLCCSQSHQSAAVVGALGDLDGPALPRAGLTHRGVTEGEFARHADGRPRLYYTARLDSRPHRLVLEYFPQTSPSAAPSPTTPPSPRWEQEGVLSVPMDVRLPEGCGHCPRGLCDPPPRGAARVRASPMWWQVSRPHAPLPRSNSCCVDGPHSADTPPPSVDAWAVSLFRCPEYCRGEPSWASSSVGRSGLSPHAVAGLGLSSALGDQPGRPQQGPEPTGDAGRSRQPFPWPASNSGLPHGCRVRSGAGLDSVSPVTGW